MAARPNDARETDTSERRRSVTRESVESAEAVSAEAVPATAFGSVSGGSFERSAQRMQNVGHEKTRQALFSSLQRQYGNNYAAQVAKAYSHLQRSSSPLESQNSSVRTHTPVAGYSRARIQREPTATETAAKPISSEVDEQISETISDAPKPYGAWNGKFSWDSRFALTIDKAKQTLTVSVRIYSTATKKQKQVWKEAIESKWSGKHKIVVSDEKGKAVATYPITIDLDYVDDAKKAHYTVKPQSKGATSGGRAGLGGTTSMTDWGTADKVDITHEFGHMLGNHEDYFKTNGHDYTNGGKRQGFRDKGGGIMNNPSENPFTEHYELIRQKTAKALGLKDSQCSVK